MIEADVNLLDRRSRTRWHVDEEVAHICRQADRGHLEVARRTKCLDDVRGISRRADPENRASGCAVSFDLTREDRIVGIVVRQRGQDRRIRRQADAVQCATFFQETPDEFAGDMHGVGRRTAVAANQQRPGRLERLHNGINRRLDRRDSQMSSRIGESALGLLQILDNAH